MIMILLILTVVWFTNSDSIQSAREFIQNNIYVWSETQEEKLPIYCVDTDKQRIALTFDTAWGNEDIPQILKILKQENVKATFFFCGDWNIQLISKQSMRKDMILQVMEIIINI